MNSSLPHPVAPLLRRLVSASRFIGAVLFASTSAVAATTTVTSISALQTAINGANPGDVIILRNGSYTTSSAININRQGTSSAPILIRAETVGGATIGGSGSIRFTSPAAWCTVQGFVLTHSGSLSIPSGTSHCRYSRNVIQLSIPSGSDVSYINIQGDDAQIDYNELRNKSTLGNMLDITGSGSQVARRLWVHHNYFHDFTSPGGNGAETIRWGLSGLSLSTGNGLCEHNLFVRCRGENEMISNKSSGNVFRYNTVLESAGGEISQRHGDNCQYYGNYMRGSAGIRIYGDNHLLHSNYLEGNSKGIDIGNGDGDVHNGAPLTSHDRPDNCVIVHNTLINNTSQYQMGGRTNGLGARNTTFSNNIIQGGNSAANISTSAPYTGTWAGNIIWNTTAGSMPSSGFTNVNPQLVQDARGVFHISSSSPAIDTAVGTFSGVTVDMDGQPRTGAKDKGADEFSSATVAARLLTTADVGPQADLNQTPTASAPVFSPGGGTFTSPQTVTITSATSGATIRYTTNGTNPTETTGTVYTGPVSISSTTNLRAIATAPGHNSSSVTSATYTINTGPAGTDWEAESLTRTASGATATTDTDAAASGGARVTLNATATGAFVEFTLPNVPAGTYSVRLAYKTNANRGILALRVNGAQVGGTLDQYAATSTYPTTTFGNVTLAAGNHLLRLTVTGKNAASSSFTLSADRIILVPTTAQVATPSFSPAGGTFTTPQSVTISTSTGGATIRFTTDGSTPTSTTGTVYTGPITISSTTTVRAIASLSGMSDSSVASATYTISSTPTTTTITSANGFVNRGFAAQTGTFTFTIDASASLSPSNAIVGLSSGAQTAYTGMAAAVRFNQSGAIDARNGGAYAAASTIPFSAGATYRFRLVVNVATRTYSAFVTPPGGSELTIGTNFAFRTEQAGVTSLNNAVFNVNATPGGSMTYGPTTITP